MEPEVEILSESLLSTLSIYVGVPEVALKVLLTILFGYPLALIYRTFLYDKRAKVKHLYFITTGLILGVWNFGAAFNHTVFATFFTYVTLLLLGGTDASVAITFIFNMTYLIIGYVYSATEHYDINWTVPQCVLVLKLIGLSYDLYDGRKPTEKLSEENKKVALIQRPTLLETFGFALFPSGFLIGPQFSMKRYQDFVGCQFVDKGETCKAPTSCVFPAIKRFLCGVGYLVVYQAIGLYVNDDYLLSGDFVTQKYLKKLLLMGVWGRYTLYKYISVWLLTEGACILYGLTHNGTDDDGNVRWDGLANVDLVRLETATEFNHYIQSFNINTNHWVAQYVYKRLKFLGSRHLSQLAALMFLALWHGFHTGYYVCFLFEFLVIYMERDIQSVLSRNPKIGNFLNGNLTSTLVYIILRLYTFVFMGWCLIPFALLTFEKYWKVFKGVHYAGIVLFAVYPFVYGPFLKLVIKKRRPEPRDD